jgi:hypothetical protein
LTTRDTVFRPTPASAATSTMVGRRVVWLESDNEVRAVIADAGTAGL